MQPIPYYKRTKNGEARTYLVSKNYVIADILQWWCEAVLVSANTQWSTNLASPHP